MNKMSYEKETRHCMTISQNQLGEILKEHGIDLPKDARDLEAVISWTGQQPCLILTWFTVPCPKEGPFDYKTKDRS